MERLVARLDELTDHEPAVGGLGLHGGLLDTGRGRVTAPVGANGVVAVDHIHGGYLPVYRRSALESVGGFDSTLFWGFEELDLGRRLSAAGSILYVDTDHWHDVAQLYPRPAPGAG